MSGQPNPLSAPPAPGGPRMRTAPSRWSIGVAAILALLLACMLASFPARNSDVWRHLATGRALLSGTYTFGVDPFSYTTEGVAWVNYAWLWDAGLYAIHAWCGDRLVIGNALLAVGAAVLMLLCAWVFQRPWTAS